MSSQGEAVQAERPAATALRQVLSPAFATHVDIYSIDGSARLNTDLLAAIAELRRTEQSVTASNQLGWHSARDLFDRQIPAFAELYQHIKSAVTISTRRTWKEFDPENNIVRQEAWANVNGKGAFNVVHEHETYHFSGAYYVAVAKAGAGRSGAIEFLNPAGISPLPLPNRAHISPPKLTLIPKTGSILVFPSYLRHWVYPSQEEEDRVSIAFNIRLGNAEAAALEPRK